MKQQTVNYQIAWSISNDISNTLIFLELAKEIKDGIEIGTPESITINLNGSPSGINISGDPDEALIDLNSFDDKSFISGSFKAVFPSHNNLVFNLSINFSQNFITINLKNGNLDLSSKIYKFILKRLPRYPEPTEDESQTISLELTRLIKEAEKAVQNTSEAEASLQKINASEAKCKNFLTKLRKNMKRQLKIYKKLHKKKMKVLLMQQKSLIQKTKF